MVAVGDDFKATVKRHAHGVVEKLVVAFEIDLLPSFFDGEFDDVDRCGFVAHVMGFDEVAVVK